MADEIAGMRREYESEPLEEASLAPTWLDQLRVWLGEAIAAGLTEPNAMVLATASAEALPGARTVLLKALDERGLCFYTNLRSRKGRELEANPRVAAVLPWLGLHRQVVVDGTVEALPAEESDAYFASRPRDAQLGAIASPQSQPVASRAALDARLAELALRHPEGEDPPRPQWWGGYVIAPEAVEFWQGRRSRLHDRLRYRREGGAWIVERLAP